MSLADDLKPLRTAYMPIPFWFWNDAMEPAEVRRQAGLMHAQNIGGYFMHARMGRVTPYMSDAWMAAIRAGVDEARRLGMEAWLYDEDGWPSGYGGGVVNALGDEFLQQYAVAEIVERKPDEPVTLEGADEVIAVFDVRRTGERFEVIRRIDVPRGSSLVADGAGGATRADEARPAGRRSHSDAGSGGDRFHEVAGSALEGDRVVIFRRELYRHRRYFSPECWADGYVDVLNPRVTRAFIRKIYEPYRRVIGEAFGSVVPGVFTDEPNYRDHRWCTDDARLTISPVLEREFERRYGSSLIDALMLILYGGEGAPRARWCYFASLAHLFANNFTRILADWCGRYGLALTGHYLLEESPRAATQVVGDVMQHYAFEQYPGIDHLGRPLDLSTFWSSSRVLVKQAVSVAHQLDKPRVMCETYAGGGWDFGPVEQKWMGDWLYALGVNLCCPHAFHYSLRGFRKRDYPPSLSFQQPWWPMSGDLGAHVGRLSYLLTRGRRVVDVLVLHPIESFFATHDVRSCPWPDDPLHDALKRLTAGLVDHQIDFDFGNEVLMRRHGSVEGDRLRVGSGSYRVVIVPHSVTWRRSTLRLLREFVAGGGTLLWVEPGPTHVEAEPSRSYAKLLDDDGSLGPWDAEGFIGRLVEAVRGAAAPSCTLRGGEHDRSVVVMHRRAEDQDIFFLASALRTPHTTRAVFNVSGAPMLLDTTTGALEALPAAMEDGQCTVELAFDDGRSFALVFDGTTDCRPSREDCHVERRLCGTADRLAYEMDQENALLLDQCELVIGDRPEGPMPVLDAQVRLKKKAAAGVPVSVRYTFDSAVSVTPAWLVVETPERFRITLNGESIGPAPAGVRRADSRAGGTPLSDPPGDAASADRWFVDPSMRRVPIPGGIRPGRHEVELQLDWDRDVEIEPLCLLGRFGVYERQGRWRIEALPDALAVGSWHDQGLAFYAGTVTYPFTVDLDVEAVRWELHCPKYRSAVRVRVNGEDAGAILWAPHRLDVTERVRPGVNRIEIQVANSLRNLLGPHHLANEDEIECLGPHHFFDRGLRCETYRFKPAGLLGGVILRGFR